MKKPSIILATIFCVLAGCNFNSDKHFIGKWSESGSSSFGNLTLYKTNDALFGDQACVWKKTDTYTALVTCNRLAFEFRINKNNPNKAIGLLDQRYHRIE